MQTTIENPFEIILKRLTGIENQIRFINQQKSRPEPDFLNLEQAAVLLNYSKATIYKKVSAHEIPFYKSGKKLRFKKAELMQLIEAGKPQM